MLFSLNYYCRGEVLGVTFLGCVSIALVIQDTKRMRRNIGCPTRYLTRHFFNSFTVSQQLGSLQTHTTDTFLFISHTTNVLLFKFRCNIFIGVRIIKEMSGSVASGTRCILSHVTCPTVQYFSTSYHKRCDFLGKVC